jgi:hypothetical protein
VPWGVNALGGTISEAAWKAKPSWYLLTTEDRMLPPDAERLMSKRAGATVVEVKSSHAVYVSQIAVLAIGIPFRTTPAFAVAISSGVAAFPFL